MTDLELFAQKHGLTCEVETQPFITDERLRGKGFVDGVSYEGLLLRDGVPFARGGGRTRELAERDTIAVGMEKLGLKLEGK